jgi:peptidoglycan glycosyltransferase
MIQSTEVTKAPEATLKRVGGQPHGAERAEPNRPSPARARKRRRVLGAGVLVAGAAFGTGLLLGAQHVPGAQRTADRFGAAWSRGDFAAMYSELTDVERTRVRRGAFAAAYQGALDTATARRVVTRPARRDGDAYRVPVRIETRIFGTIRGVVRVPVSDAGVDWSRDLVFPGLRRGERLSRTTRAPERASLLARDKTPLAQGPERSSPLGAVATSITGSLGPIPEDRRADLAALGVPADAKVGVSGLERIFDVRLLGRPGGDLRAGGRLLATAAPERAAPVRTTISTKAQAAAVDALGPRLGGILAMDPRTGGVLAASGIALSGLQPPGSTFKILTVTGALEARLTSPTTGYPVQTKATLEGVDLENANGEACGGTLV